MRGANRSAFLDAQSSAKTGRDARVETEGGSSSQRLKGSGGKLIGSAGQTSVDDLDMWEGGQAEPLKGWRGVTGRGGGIRGHKENVDPGRIKDSISGNGEPFGKRSGPSIIKKIEKA